MQNKLFHIAHKLLSKNGIGFAPDILKQQLLSHPDFPSLAAFSDTFTDMGIENLAFQLQPTDLDSLEQPYLAVLQNEGGEQLVYAEPTANNHIWIDDGQKQKRWDKSYFLKVWGGRLLAVEANDENRRTKKETVRRNMSMFFLPLGLIGFCILWFHISSLAYWQCLLCMVGISVAITLWQAEQGNAVVSKFCNISASTSCDAVLKSPAGKLLGKLPLTFVVFTYFSWQTISWLLWKNAGAEWIPFIQLLVLPVTMYTLWQQAFVIKKWCPLCLVTTAILWMQALISIIHFIFYPQDVVLNVEILQVLTHTCLILLITLGALELQKAIGTYTKQERLSIENLAFRRNYHLFLPWYKEQEPIPDTLNKVHKGIHANGEMSTIQLIVITNPLCEACQRIHHVWEQLLEKYHEEISIEWRFYVPTDNLNDPRSMISAWLLKQWQDGSDAGLSALHKWYQHPNLMEFDKLRIAKIELEPMLKKLQAHGNWCKENNLNQTPILLVNGRRFPNWYMQEDIIHFIENLLESDESSLNIIQAERMNYHGVMLADT